VTLRLAFSRVSIERRVQGSEGGIARTIAKRAESLRANGEGTTAYLRLSELNYVKTNAPNE